MPNATTTNHSLAKNASSTRGPRRGGRFSMPRSSCSSATGTRRCRFATSPQRSSTAPARSTATSHRRTRSSSPWPKRASDCSAPRSSSTRRATTRSMTFAPRPGVSTSSARSSRSTSRWCFSIADVPRIGREYERFAFMSELKSRLRAQVQRCIDEGIFPASVDADVGLRLLWASDPRDRGTSPVGPTSGRRRGRPRSRRDRHDHRWLAGRRTITCAPLDTFRFVFSF